MMQRPFNFPQHVLLLALASASLCGCSDTNKPASTAETAAPTRNVSRQAADEDLSDPTPAVSDSQTKGDDIVSGEQTEFQPPFPNRSDLFLRPDADKAAVAARQRKVERGDVQLKGFVNVGRPKAMLHVDGQLWLASEGDRRDDMQIVSVAPPKVSLTRHGTVVDLSLHGEP